MSDDDNLIILKPRDLGDGEAIHDQVIGRAAGDSVPVGDGTHHQVWVELGPVPEDTRSDAERVADEKLKQARAIADLHASERAGIGYFPVSPDIGVSPIVEKVNAFRRAGGRPENIRIESVEEITNEDINREYVPVSRKLLEEALAQVLATAYDWDLCKCTACGAFCEMDHEAESAPPGVDAFTDLGHRTPIICEHTADCRYVLVRDGLKKALGET